MGGYTLSGLNVHPDYIVHQGKKTKVVIDIKEFEDIKKGLAQVEEYEEALRLSRNPEFAEIIQQALSSATVLKNKTAEEVLNEI